MTPNLETAMMAAKIGNAIHRQSIAFGMQENMVITPAPAIILDRRGIRNEANGSILDVSFTENNGKSPYGAAAMPPLFYYNYFQPICQAKYNLSLNNWKTGHRLYLTFAAVCAILEVQRLSEHEKGYRHNETTNYQIKEKVKLMLFNPNPKKTERAQCLIERYEKEVQTDTQKRYYYPLLFSALNYDPTPGHIWYIGEVTKNLIAKKDAFFSANLMHSYNSENVDADPAAWKLHCTPDGYRALLICGSAHPNGYFREKCLKLLANERDVLQFILLRMNDWVPAIRRSAWTILQEQLQSNPSCTELIQAMPMVEFVRRGQRAQRNTDFSMDALDAMIMKILAENPQAVLRSRISQRRLCYKVFMLHSESGYRDLILFFIRHERDNAQRSALVRFYLNTAEQPVYDELLDFFMQDTYWHIRLDAYEYRMKHEGTWNGMESLLLSPYYPIREFAAFYLEKSGFDNLGYCRTHLPETLLALSDLGTKADTALIRPYLETHPREALIALVRLDDDNSKELVWDAMHDSNAKLAKTAYRLALTHKLYKFSELLPKIKEETDIQRRWRLIRLLGFNVGSELLPILIRMTRDYAHVRGDIMTLIQSMCGYPKHGYYGIFVTQTLHDEITEALHYASGYIPADLHDCILRSMNVRK